MLQIWRRPFTKAMVKPATGRRRTPLAPRPSLAVEQLEGRLVPSTLIPVANHRDLVFDAMRGLLDITTSSGVVQQFSVQAQQLVGGIGISRSLNGADISPDGNFLYLADPQTNGAQDVLDKLDLNSFALSKLTFNHVNGELGSWDIAFASGGKGLVSTMANGSGSVPLRQLTLSTGALTMRSDIPGGWVAQNTLIHRSADRSLLLLTEPNNGIVMTYGANTDRFLPGPAFGPALANAPAAVNRNGTLLAIEVNGQAIVMDPSFNTRITLPGLDGGVVFDPNQDVMYAVNSSTGQIIGYDTNTWAIKFQQAIGEPVTPGQAFGNGVMAISGDSRWLFLATPSGVREFSLQNPNPATHFTINSSFNGIATAGTPFSMTVIALDANNQVANGYQGTLHFSSSDPQASLPADYTFTPADAGAHTFTFALKTAGTQALSWVDVHNSNLGLYIPNITVNPGALATFRVDVSGPQAAGYAFWPMISARDAYNNIITTYTGTIHITSSDPTAILPADYTFTASDRGLHSLPVTLGTTGNQSLIAKDTQNSYLYGSATVQVLNYIPGLHFAETASASSVQAGSPFTMTIAAYDRDNQVATRYVGTIAFTGTDHGQGVVLPANYTFTAADAGVHTFSVTLVTATNLAWVDFYDSAYVTSPGGNPGGGYTSGGVSVAVTPAAASTFSVTGFPSPVTAGSAGTFTVTAEDPYGNVATGYTGTVSFASSDSRAVLPAAYTFSAGDLGTHAFSASLLTAGLQALTVVDSTTPTLTGSQTGITVNAGAASMFVISAPAAAQAGTAFSVTVTAEDAYGNVATGYTGTVHFQSTDSTASLPADYTFQSGDAGVQTFQMTLWTPGIQTLLVSDAGNNYVTGSAQVSM
jgi:hypothetical protein